MFLFACSAETAAQGITAKIADWRTAETAFVLTRTAGILRYAGVAHFDEERGQWMLRTK